MLQLAQGIEDEGQRAGDQARRNGGVGKRKAGWAMIQPALYS